MLTISTDHYHGLGVLRILVRRRCLDVHLAMTSLINSFMNLALKIDNFVYYLLLGLLKHLLIVLHDAQSPLMWNASARLCLQCLRLAHLASSHLAAQQFSPTLATLLVVVATMA